MGMDTFSKELGLPFSFHIPFQYGVIPYTLRVGTILKGGLCLEKHTGSDISFFQSSK